MGQYDLLAKAEPLLSGPHAIERLYCFLIEVEPPIIRIGPDLKFEVDFYMHSPSGVIGFLFALASGAVIVVCNGFERPLVLVLCLNESSTLTKKVH